MNNAKAKGLCAFAIILMAGAGCAGGADSTITPVAETPEQPSGKMKAEIPFSEVKANILDAKEGYREIRFAELTGSCAEAGLSDNLSYVEDMAVGSFIVKDNMGNFEDDSVTATAEGEVHFDGITFLQDFVHCVAHAPAGEDAGEVSCTDANDKAFCTGMYKLTAVPR